MAFQLLFRPAVTGTVVSNEMDSIAAVQAESIRALLQGDEHLIITANTAGGKTEAAFLPIPSRIVCEHREVYGQFTLDH